VKVTSNPNSQVQGQGQYQIPNPNPNGDDHTIIVAINIHLANHGKLENCFNLLIKNVFVEFVSSLKGHSWCVSILRSVTLRVFRSINVVEHLLTYVIFGNKLQFLINLKLPFMSVRSISESSPASRLRTALSSSTRPSTLARRTPIACTIPSRTITMVALLLVSPQDSIRQAATWPTSSARSGILK
jgi:hypothetical protein